MGWGADIQGHSLQCSKLKAHLGYMSLILKKRKKRGKRERKKEEEKEIKKEGRRKGNKEVFTHLPCGDAAHTHHFSLLPPSTPIVSTCVNISTNMHSNTSVN